MRFCDTHNTYRKLYSFTLLFFKFTFQTRQRHSREIITKSEIVSFMKCHAAVYGKSSFFGLERHSSTNILPMALINDTNTLGLIITSFSFDRHHGENIGSRFRPRKNSAVQLAIGDEWLQFVREFVEQLQHRWIKHENSTQSVKY